MKKIPETLDWKATGKTLGEGGQGQVYEVVDKNFPATGRFAMKIISANRSQKVYERFYKEIAAIRAINHPSIIKIVDNSAIGSDFHYYVMEFSEGSETLSDLMKSSCNPFSGNAAASVDLFIQICDGLDACHSHSPMILHRDLSPSNILVLPDKSIKIIDFGICQIEGKERITLTDEDIGTPNYRAPECESGAEGQINACSDIYSAGKILWAAITGQHAFAREKPAFSSKSMQAIFPDKYETWHLHHIFERTIRRDPETRWQKAQIALIWARRVRLMVTSGSWPLELIHEKCPICLIGSLDEFQGGHMVFGNPNPEGIVSLKCKYCGYCFAIDLQLIKNRLVARKQLE